MHMPILPRLLPLLALAVALLSPGDAACASVAAADDVKGYSGRVLSKVVKLWTPPPALKGDFQVQVTVSVDGAGKVVDCETTRTSGLEAMDASACGAVTQAASFGKPEGGNPTEVYLVFWSGTPKGKKRPKKLSTEEALRAEIEARDKAERAMAEQMADDAERSALERAQAAAKETGKDVPDIVVPPPAPPAKIRKGRDADGEKGGTAKTDTKTPPGAATAEPAPDLVIAPSGTKATPERPKASPESAKSEPADAAPDGQVDASRKAEEGDDRQDGKSAAGDEAGKPGDAEKAKDAAKANPESPDKANPERGNEGKYLSTLIRTLRKAIILPKSLPSGTWQTTVTVRVAPDGALVESGLKRESGEAVLDRSILEQVGAMKKLPPPPDGAETVVDVPLKFKRMGKKATRSQNAGETPDR
ncbi:MAG: TonB family protein [Desulfovibrio sp.]|jgi:TolA protein|nr:TonB family protein [Desulfovibrio sp.]